MLLITDTSVLVNFLNVDRTDLIGSHEPKCMITDHVLQEVTDSYPEQKQRLEAAIAAGYVTATTVSDDVEVELFARLLEPGRLGSGECSAISVAIKRNYSLGIDDRRAIKVARSIALDEGVELQILGTQDIVRNLIVAGVLTVEAADALLVAWREDHRFVLKIGSFAELLAD